MHGAAAMASVPPFIELPYFELNEILQYPYPVYNSDDDEYDDMPALEYVDNDDVSFNIDAFHTNSTYIPAVYFHSFRVC